MMVALHRLVDQNTQQNAALVEESMASAQQLRAQSGQLVNAVGAFRGTNRHRPRGEGAIDGLHGMVQVLRPALSRGVLAIKGA